MTGDEVEWVARPGVNLDARGRPQPWRAPARGVIRVSATSKDEAVALAAAANPEYHTVESVREAR